MRHPLTRLSILVPALLVTSCLHASSPTEPTVASSGDLSAETLSASRASPSTTVIEIPVVLGFNAGTLAAIEACVGEAVTFVGDAVLVAHRTDLPDGSQRMVIHGNPQGAVGIGAVSGKRYRLAANDTFVLIVGPSGPVVSTFTANLWVIGPRGRPRFGGPILVHVTIMPTGEVTADVEMLDRGFQCIT